ncbi:MAG: glycosyltransferase family 2 protein, partial [Halobacteriaceae archaeon]
MLNVSSMYSISRYMTQSGYGELGSELSDLMPPVTVVIPAYNEEKTIVETVKSVLQLEYPSLNVVVVNDGSSDETASRLIDHFDMEITTVDQPDALSTEPINSVHSSYSKQNLSLVNKENGGKADALNAGINLSRTPFVCCIDADSVLDRDCLKALIRPFLFDEDTVAVGGTVRVANGCEVDQGFISSVNLPDTLLPLFQVVEYLRAFLFGRMGWDPINGLMVISGAFGLFERSALVEVGGYHTDNVAEDMELVVRMHRKLSERERDYKIRYIPDPVCWTEVPEDLNSLRSQRTRWQHGLAQSVMKNLSLLFKPGSGWAGWLAFPYLILFEGIGALIEVLGYVYIASGLLMGFVEPPLALAFFVVAIAFGVFVSVVSFLLEV